MNDTLFDLPEPQSNKFIEPALTRKERQQRINQNQKINEMAADSQSWTSAQAAVNARPKMRGIKMQIVELLERYVGGLTCAQIVELLNKDRPPDKQLEKPSVSPRLSECEKKKIIYVDGSRPSNNGSPANVYKLVKVEP